MSVKSESAFIRNLLYLCDIIEHQSISKAADKNGIKAPNLSLMMNDLEKQIGTPLLCRTPRGTFPTFTGSQIYDLTNKLKHIVTEIEQFSLNLPHTQQQLNIFVSPDLELCDCQDFSTDNPDLLVNFTNNENLADICLLNRKPQNPLKTYTELSIGKGLTQRIWLICNENHPDALRFFDFIIAKLLP